jgi:hypothetical protein
MREHRAPPPAEPRFGEDERKDELRRAIVALRSDQEWAAIRDAKLALFRSEYGLAYASGRNPVRLVPASLISPNGTH